MLTTTGGALLTIVPALDGRSRMAIVGYLLPPLQPSANDSAELRVMAAPGLVIDRAQHRVLIHGRDATLLFQEFELLELLATNPGRVFSREEIIGRAWSSHPPGTSRTVDIHIHRLRRKLGPSHAGCLVTVRRVGYMFRRPNGS
jgi:DNA-binding response OmpR family regulator